MQSASPSKSNPGHGKKPSGGVQTSQDWAGYAVTGTTFSNVAGSWTQPTATCPKNQVQQAAFWVGIDGYSASDPTVQQIGTDSDCTKGKGKKGGGPNYYAWYQLYPQSVVVLPTSSYPVTKGDAISASVSRVWLRLYPDHLRWHQMELLHDPNPHKPTAEFISRMDHRGTLHGIPLQGSPPGRLRNDQLHQRIGKP